MENDLELLEDSLRRRVETEKPGQPTRFLQAVRSRRRRVYATRALATIAVVLVLGFGLIAVRGPVRSQESSGIQQVAYGGPPAIRKFRELPPENAVASGAVDVIRVRDARDPMAVSGLGGF